MQGSVTEKRDERARQRSRRLAAERLSTPDQLDQVIEVARFPHWLLLGALFLLLGAGIAASILVPVPLKVRGEGILINIEGVLTVTSEHAGRLEELMVAPGQLLQAGQLVARIAQPELEQRLRDRRAELEEARHRRQQVEAFHQRMSSAQRETRGDRRRALEQRLDFTRSRLAIQQKQLADEEDLAHRGIIAARQLNETRTRINETTAEVTSIENELQRLERLPDEERLEQERELLALDLMISDLERRVVSLEAEKKRRSEVRSPYHGRVVELKVNRGEIVESNGPLVSLLPWVVEEAERAPIRAPSLGPAAPRAPGMGELVAVLYVPPGEGKKIRRGMEVQVTPSSVKREEFGFMVGTVESVAEVPSTEEGMMRILKNRQLVQQLSRDHAPFEVMVRLDRDPTTESGYRWSTSRGPAAEINVGTLCQGDVITRRERLIAVILPALRRTFDA
jgi:HlyD family secretion protein